MCRFLAYRGEPVFMEDLISAPAHSLVHQSLHAEEAKTGTNGDVVTALAEVYMYVFSVRHGAAVSMGSKPASSSWVTIIVTMVGMRGRLVSMTKCAAAW